jgi:hypothetical protein
MAGAGEAVFMKFEAKIVGNIRDDFKREYNKAERVMTAAVKEATDGAKMDMRGQVARAGYSRRLQNTWRGVVFPKPPKMSVNPAGVLYTKARKIFEGLEYGSTIRSQDGYYLAIPTENAPKRIYRKRVTPTLWEDRYGEQLRFVYNRNGPALLVAENRRASYSRKTGQLRGFRKASKTALRTGKGLTSVVMFILVPVVRLKKKLSLFDTAEKWQRRMPDLIDKQWVLYDAGD